MKSNPITYVSSFWKALCVAFFMVWVPHIFGQSTTLEAENMTTTGTSGVAITNNNDTNASGGVWVLLASTAVNQYIQFTTPSIAAGTYQVQFRYKTNTTRAQHSVAVDGTSIGSVDQYSATVGFTSSTLGNVTFASAGTHTLKLTVTGKNSASTGYQISADSFTLVPQNVAAPTFSPAAGSYTSTQSVTISTTTTGASIRYTTDGSTPSATAGTLYAGPVAIAATTTLNAIAYETGLNDSTVTTGTYSIGPATVTLEAENLTSTSSGPAITNNNDTNASGGVWVLLNSTATGQWIKFTTPSIAAGTYQLQLRYKSNTTRAQHTVLVDGTQVGGTIDQYAATVSFLTATIGNVSFGTAATHTIELFVTGKNAASTGYQVAADSFTLLPQTTPQAAAPTFSPAAGTYASPQSVTIGTTTSGASIRYTSDGSTPSETAGTLYTGPVTVGATEALKAIAYETGYTDSNVSSAAYTINLPQAGAPTFSPAAGTYTSVQSVTISTTTSGASIRYTTDGSTPSETVGTLYAGPVSVGATETLNAIAYATGYTDSSVSSAAYIINLPQAAAPTFSPAAGTYTSAQSVTIASTTTGASIRYTTDGSTPTEINGTLYAGPVAISTTTTLQAIVYANGFTDSAVTSGTYTINTSSTITLQASGLSPMGSGQAITTTTDAAAPGGDWVKIATTAALQYLSFTTPSIPAGTYQFQFVYRTNPTRAQHNITIDSTQVASAFDQYAPSPSAYLTAVVGNVTFVSAATHTIQLTVSGHNAASTGYDMSAVQFIFVPQPPQVATPTFSPAGGAYTSAQSVTIATTTAGASIRYTTDGSTPTETNGTLYSGPVAIGATTTLQAVAYASGMTDSTVTSATYTINSGSGNFTFTPGMPIFVDASEAGPIQVAIADLQRDLKSVFGVSSPVVNSATAIAGQPAIVVTCSGAATASYRDSSLVGVESHELSTTGTSSEPRFVLQGADIRGTIYSIYEFSDRYLNIPPLWYWITWQPQTMSSLTVPSNLSLKFASPAVLYRGWFPNDEDLIGSWLKASSSNYAALFETLLRLKYNTLDVNNISDVGGANQGLTWARECKRRGIIVTFTHYAPFGADIGEYGSVVGGSPSVNNVSGLKQFWTHYINLATNEGLETLQTIVFRGHGDTAWWNSIGGDPGTSSGRASIISSMMSTQMSLLRSVTGNQHPAMRTIFYSEVADFMDQGTMNPPVDADLIWSPSSDQRDHYPTPDTTSYDYTTHLSGKNLFGYYFNLQFYTTGAHLAQAEGPWKAALNHQIVNQQAGPVNFVASVINVGNVREFLMEESVDADLLWNLPTFNPDASVQNFCTRYFGASVAPQVASLYQQYFNAFWQQKKSDTTTFPNGFPRQFLFQDLRYARAAEILLTDISNHTYGANPFDAQGPRYFRVIAADNNASNELDAAINGTTNAANGLSPVASSCDSLFASIPTNAQPLYNDNLRQQAKFMLGCNLFLQGLANADKALSNGGSVLTHLKEAEVGMNDMTAALAATTQGIFSGWYSNDTKFNVQSLKSRLNSAITQYGGTP